MPETKAQRHKRLGRCSACLNPPAPNKRRCKKCLERNRLGRIEYYKQNKEECKRKVREKRVLLHKAVYDYYGPNCRCCDESESTFLQIDHINNDGYKHRKEIGPDLIKWLVKNDFPEGFQVLCANCNWSKRFGGVCIHVRIATSV
jgi:hypothetical protein